MFSACFLCGVINDNNDSKYFIRQLYTLVSLVYRFQFISPSVQHGRWGGTCWC